MRAAFLSLLLASGIANAAYRDCTSIATTSGTSTSLTVTAPSGTAQDDIVILCAAVGGGASETFTWPTSTTFTEIGNASIATPDTKTIKCAWTREDASPAATYQVANSVGGGDKMILIACAFSGRHTTNPPVAQVSTQTSAAASPITIAATGVTAVAGDDILWYAVGASTDGFSGWDFTAPTNYTEREDVAADFYTYGSVATRDNVSAGATGSISGTMTLGGSTGGWGAIVMRIPAAAGGGGASSLPKIIQQLEH